MATPSWNGASPAQPTLAAQINQFVGAHATTSLYAATSRASQLVAGSTSTATNGVYLAQQFTTAVGQTAIGYVSIPLTSYTASGSSLGVITLSLYANSAGAPTGAALITTTVSTEYAYLASNSGSSATAFILYPLPITGLTASTTYWLVTNPVGTGPTHYRWYQSNQVSGASTSTNGTTWSAQTYGLGYNVFDQGASGLLTATWEDAGARWSTFTYTATTNQLKTIAEYTVAQGAGNYVQGYRVLGYTTGYLTSIT